jgi:hypothetical protein
MYKQASIIIDVVRTGFKAIDINSLNKYITILITFQLVMNKNNHHSQYISFL